MYLRLSIDEADLSVLLNYRIEPCKVIYPDGKERITPDISPRQTTARASYVNSCTGLSLTAEEVSTLLTRMSLGATVSLHNADELRVEVPPTRPDILHECDIMEDAAIAYGFNNLPDTFPATSTVAQPLAISKLSDVVRIEWALAGWVEVLPLILVSQLYHLIAYSLLKHYRTVFARRKLRMAQPQRRRNPSCEDCESENTRIPSRPHFTLTRSTQNNPRKSFPPSPNPRFRGF